MNQETLMPIGVFALVGWLIWRSILSSEIGERQAELFREQSTREELRQTAQGLQSEIIQSQEFQTKVTQFVKDKREAQGLMCETLESIRNRLKGAEHLRCQIEALQEEFRGFKQDAHKYQQFKSVR